MGLKDLWHLIKSDARFYGGSSFLKFIYIFLFSAKFRTILNYRLGRYFYLNGWSVCSDWLKYRQLTVRGCQISYSAKIGERVELKHPLGVVIGEDVVVCSDVKIWQQVTIGSHGKPQEGMSYPTIESGVKIFAGAKVFGGITIGKDSVIAANSVVNKSCPQGDILAGIPAKSIKKV